ncbi:MAG: AraC family transcriptional regulator ligand-binding domain-containing protein, partial [Myxococcota bacterium]
LRAALFAGTGLSQEAIDRPNAEITLGQQLRQLRNVRQIFPPGIALALGAHHDAVAHGPVGFAAVTARTLGESFEVIARYCHVRNPTQSGRTLETGNEFRLIFEDRCELEEEERLPLVEMHLVSVQGVVEAVLAGPMTEGRFELAAAAPSYAARYRDYFHAEVRFSATHTCIVIPAAWRALGSPYSDPVMHQSALRELEALARALDGADCSAARVEQCMVVAGDAGISLDDLARRLGVSKRTLARRLHEEGTSYQGIRDAHLQRRAKELLAEGILSKAEIAYRLGYQDPANFGRAFRRWFGSTSD